MYFAATPAVTARHSRRSGGAREIDGSAMAGTRHTWLASGGHSYLESESRKALLIIDA
jgi:hypothetical protein